MAYSTPKSAYWSGFRNSTPFLVVAAPFAILFGVFATEAGLTVLETLTFSMAVIAGAAQFTALALIQTDAPTLIVLASALAVNLRLAMYSASLTPYLGEVPLRWRALAAYLLVDQVYAFSIAKFETSPDMTWQQRIAYFCGLATPLCFSWYAFTVIGAVAGTAIPESWALDFVVPLAFLAITGPMLRTPAHRVAAVVGVVVALLSAGLPYSLGLMVGGLAGMTAGAQTELWMERRR